MATGSEETMDSLDEEASLNAQANQVRHATVGLLETMTERARSVELPSPPPSLAAWHRKLLEDSYTVLVAGELKRGKSSFVNALIGRDLLPTDVDVATSQAFRIRHAKTEACRIRFEDGSCQEIETSELSTYGSQVSIDAEHAPRLEQIVRWIEVDVPARFLPVGISLIDTPGLGSLYAAHAVITQRFVPEADAVIFALESGSPMGKEELDFIKTILEVTPHLFFIQTKIDQYRRSSWESILQRNQEILADSFGSHLSSARVWPISSRRLMKAAETGDDDYFIRSCHSEMEAALKAFLFRVSGWGRSAQAVAEAERYHTVARGTLSARLAHLQEESTQKRAEAQHVATRRKQEFERDWGSRGRRREELMTRLRQHIGLGRQNFIHSLQPKSDIFREHERAIDAVRSVEQANALGATLAAHVGVDVTRTWRRVIERVGTQCAADLQPLTLAGDALASFGTVTEPVVTEQFEPVDQSFLGTLSRARGEVVTVSSLSGVGLGALAAAHVITFATGGLAALPIALCGLAFGWRGAKQREVRAARQELVRHLHEVRQELYQYFFASDAVAGRPALVDDCLDQLERTLAEQVDATVALKSEEARAELARQVKAAQLDDRQRVEAAAQTRQQLHEWDSLASSLLTLKGTLTTLERSHFAAANPEGSARA